MSAAGAIEFQVVDPASDEAADAMARYFAELDRRFEGGFVADDGDEELDQMRSPNGAFVVVVLDDAVVGCGGVRRLDDQRAEVKRMWIDRSVRGRGVGRRLLTALEDQAQALGCCDIVLDTNAVLDEAIALYERSGYQAIERYNDNPYAQRWFAKNLT